MSVIFLTLLRTYADETPITTKESPLDLKECTKKIVKV